MTDQKLLLTIDEVAELLSLGRSKIYQLIREGKIRPIRIGRATRVSRDEVVRWVQDEQRQVTLAALKPRDFSPGGRVSW